MENITGLVVVLIENNPEIYGADKGTEKIFSEVLRILEKEAVDAISTLTTVERIRRKFLSENPRCDFRVKDKRNRRA